MTSRPPEEPAADPDPDPPSSPPGSKDQRWTVWIGGSMAILVLVVAGIALWSWHDEASRVAHDPHVRGRVVELVERKEQEDRGSGTSMELTVDFTTLDGRVIVLRKHEQMNGRDALQILAKREVDVWYRPDDPEDALVRWGPHGGTP